MIIASQANQQLVTALAGVNYAELVSSTRHRVMTHDTLAIEEEMNELNRRLCLGFIHLHTLRGVDRPSPCFACRVDHATWKPALESLVN